MFCQELAAQLARDVLPALDGSRAKLLTVGIGTPERAREFCSHVGFPAEALYADPENAAYDALQLQKVGFGSAMVRPTTLSRGVRPLSHGRVFALPGPGRPHVPIRLRALSEQAGGLPPPPSRGHGPGLP